MQFYSSNFTRLPAVGPVPYLSLNRSTEALLPIPIPSRSFALTLRAGCYSVDVFRHAEPQANGKPTDGSHWRVACIPSTFTATPRRARPHQTKSSIPWVMTSLLTTMPKVTSIRLYSSSPFSHLDSSGRARMVDVSGKRVTVRTAAAECRLNIGKELLRLLKDGALPKGDALGVARVAGVLAAKRTSELIPLCHPLPLDFVHVTIDLPTEDTEGVLIKCEVRVTARTGAEMEALSGCSGAALALYDMCKAVDKEMVISGLRVVRKTGGKSDLPPPPPPPPSPPAKVPKPVDYPNETFAPINLVYL